MGRKTPFATVHRLDTDMLLHPPSKNSGDQETLDILGSDSPFSDNHDKNRVPGSFEFAEDPQVLAVGGFTSKGRE